MSDPTAATGVRAPRAKHQRKLSNYLLDKKLQLRYVLVVTILSGLIAGALGFLIYQQRRAASESIEKDLQVLVDAAHSGASGASESFQEQISDDLESADQALVYKMVGVGVGLVVILSFYLLIMTHKVAGPLYKVSMYFDRMADGRLTVVTPLRRGDMLQDFFQTFKETHEVLRVRAQADADAMGQAVASLRAAGDQADYRGEARSQLVEALDQLEQHVAQRQQNLA